MLRFVYFQANIWFRKLKRQQDTLGWLICFATWYLEKCSLEFWDPCNPLMGGLDVWRHLIGRSARWAGLCSVLLRVCGKSLIATDYWTWWKKAVAVTAFNILAFLRSVKCCSMNLGLENTLLGAAAHLCELAALKRNHIWSKYSAVTCAIYSVGYALSEVSEKDRRSGTNTLCSPQQCI